MRTKNLICYLIFFLVSMTMSTNAFSQTQSNTRSTFLESIENSERQIDAYETKIAWVTSNATEDSIAKAEGWYDMVNINLNKFENQIVESKIEQLKNYYSDILSFPLTENEIQNGIIPEINVKREELATDYPDFKEFIPTSESSINALENWIRDFPSQYEDFTSYLESLVLAHLQ